MVVWSDRTCTEDRHVDREDRTSRRSGHLSLLGSDYFDCVRFQINQKLGVMIDILCMSYVYNQDFCTFFIGYEAVCRWGSLTIERPSASFRAIQWSKPEKIHLKQTVQLLDLRITAERHQTSCSAIDNNHPASSSIIAHDHHRAWS